MATQGNPFTGFPMVLCVIFIILKLTGVIGWSWWWVWSPLLIVLAIGLVFAFILSFVLAIVAGCTGQNYLELCKKAQDSFKM